MASGRDIVLKIGTDIRDAIDGFRKVRQESEETQRTVARNVDSTTSRIERLASRIRSTQIGQGLKTFGESLASGAPLGEAALGGLAVAFPEFAVLETAVNLAARLADNLDHTTQRLAAAQKRLAEPESTTDVVEGFRQTVEQQTRSRGFVKTFRTTFDFFTQGGTGNEIERGRNLRADFRALVRSRPADALLVLQSYAGTSEYTELKKIYDEELAHARASAAFRDAQKGTQPVSVTNVYSAFDGLGGRNGTGRQVRSVLDARDRNNGRYQTSSRR